MKRVFIFALIFGIHSIATFLAWAEASRSQPALVIWNILATPLLHVTGSLANQHFWPLFLLNSLFWATVLSYVFIRASK